MMPGGAHDIAGSPIMNPNSQPTLTGDKICRIAFCLYMDVEWVELSFNTSLMEGSRGSIVGMATVLQAGQSGVQIPLKARDFSLLQNTQTSSGTHPASYIMATTVLSRG
jgi:hypothetical protein